VASTSITDTGSYKISVTVSDDFPMSVTTSFTLKITNDDPKVVTAPGDVFLSHGSSLSIPLASNFADDEGDAITIKATYTLSGESPVTIPNGIFSEVPSPYKIEVKSTSVADSGVYTITLTVYDLLPASVTQIFKVTVTNTAPVVASTLPPNYSMVHGTSK